MSNLEKTKKSSYLIRLFIMASVIATVACIFMAAFKDDMKLHPFWLLPLSYSLSLILIRHNVIRLAPGIIMINIVMFFRYAITPLTIYATGELSRYANNYIYLTEAIWLMLYEMIAIMLTIELTGKAPRILKSATLGKTRKFYNFRSGGIAAILITGILLFLAINYRHLTGGILLIVSGTISTTNKITDNVSGAIGIIWQASLAWMYIYVCLKIKKLSKKIILSIIISAFYILLTFIGQTNISRWHTVISFTAVYFTLIKLYPTHKKAISLLMLTPASFFFVIVTLYKNTAFLTSGQSVFNSFMGLFAASTTDAYFAGPVNYNNAVGLIENKEVGFFTIFYDLLNNMPVINHFIDTRNASVNMFNMYIGRAYNGITGDQIIPLVGQSSIYFSYILAPLLSVLSVFLIRYFDRKYHESNTPMIYIFAFTSAWIGVITILNLTIFMSWLYVRIIPLTLLIMFTEMKISASSQKSFYVKTVTRK